MQVAGETEAGSDNEQKSAADVARDRIRTFKLKVRRETRYPSC